MKHITSFTTTLLLWLCALTAWGDGITVASTYTPINDVTDGFYLLKSRIKGTNGYIYRKSGDTTRPLRQKPEASMDLTNIDLAYVWYVTKNADGVMIMQNASTGEYIPAYNGNGGDMTNLSTTTSNAALLKAKDFTPYANSLDGGVLLYQVNFGQFIHANTSGEHNLSYWEGGTPADDSSVGQFALYKLDGTISEEKITKTYAGTINIKKDDGTIVKTVYQATLLNGTVSTTAPTLSSFYSIGSDQTLSYTYTAENPVHDVTVTTSTLPFTFSTPENPVWYKLTTRNEKNNGSGNYAVWIDDNNIKTGNNAGDSHYGANYQFSYKALKGAYWAFVADGFGVKLYNYATKKFVTVGGTDAKASMNATGTTFYAQTTTATGATFSLQYSGNSYLGDHKEDYLGTWTDNDAQNNLGSGWKPIAVDENDLTIARNIASNTLPKTFSSQTNTDNALTMGNSAEAVEKGKAALAKLTESPSWSNLDEVFDGLDGVNLSAQPDLTAYYRIRNVNSELTNRYLSTENIVVSATDGLLSTAYTKDTSIDRKITRKSNSDNFGSQLWHFTQNSDGTITLVNANTAREFGEASTSPIEMPINIGYGNGHYRFMPYTENVFDGYDANSMFVMYDVNGNQVGVNGDNYVAQNNDQYTNKSNYWQIIKVTEVPVTIKSAGWASVSYPFAVKVPTESGVKAYIAETAEGTTLSLKEIEDGIIPANTGVLLAKEGGCTINLPLTTTTASYANVNKLVGTAAERSGYTTETTYVLSAKGGNVGFLPSTLTIVPSNKAFLPKANITTSSSEAQMLNFYVNGSITGISQAQTNEQADTTYYDLNGRRVLYPTQGIYVTGNGKKVFIK